MSRDPGNSIHRPARPGRPTALVAAALALSLGAGALASLAGTPSAGADVTIPGPTGPVGNPLPTPPPIPTLPPADQLTTRYFSRSGGGRVDPFEMDGLNSIFSKWHLSGVGSISFPKVLSVGQTAAYQVCFEGYTVDRDIGSFHQQIDQSSLVVPGIQAAFGQTTNGNGYFAPLPGTDGFGLGLNESKTVNLHACHTMAFTATKAGSFTLDFGAGSTLSVLIGECPLGCGGFGPNQHKWSTATTDATWQQAHLPVQVLGGLQAMDDQATVPVGGGMRIPVLANDTVPAGAAIQITTTDGAHGSCIAIGDTVLYSNHEAAASDTCQYTIHETGSGATSTASIHVTLASAPTGPTGPPKPAKPSAPNAPTGVTATAGNGKAIVTWTAPASNGSPITGYRITVIQGLFAHDPITVGPGATSRTISGLWNGFGYQFKVEAINKLGTSPASDLSAPVVPHA